MDLILCLASKYDYSKLRPFFETIYSTGFSGDLVVFSHCLTADTQSKITSHGVILIQYSEAYPYFNDPMLASLVSNPNQYLSPNSLRYFLYNAFLTASEGKYSRVIHSDIRDVIFQSDPFSREIQGIECYLEDSGTTIGENEHNRFWIEHGFGHVVLKQLESRSISCSGFTMGELSSFQQYLALLIRYLCEIENVGGMDQGVHNYLLSQNLIKNIRVVPDDKGAVSTISNFKPLHKIQLSRTQLVLNTNGTPVNVVHQYDRYFPLLWKYDKRGYFITKWNLLKQFLLAVKKSKRLKKTHLINLKDILLSKMMKRYNWE